MIWIPEMTDIYHYINNTPYRGTASRSQPVNNPATGNADKPEDGQCLRTS